MLKFVIIELIGFGLGFALVHEDNILNWELAVAIDNQIELFQSNGSVIQSTAQPFSKLKALTYDTVRDQFIVSDTDQHNDTIFTVQVTRETDIYITPIIQDLSDDVLGLAVDPVTDMLYWTDAINRTINYVPLNETLYEAERLFAFDEGYPQAIAIDICKRYIYWTNQKPSNPSIERAKLDGTGHEVLVNTGIVNPEGITIDYYTQRLYWADTRGGTIYGRIESTNLVGKEREIVYEGTHIKPFGLAVDQNAIYWTDTINNALYRIYKNQKADPERIIAFDEKPMGLVANNFHVRELSDCKAIGRDVESYKEFESLRNEVMMTETEKPLPTECFNGVLTDGLCVCTRGFSGQYCEISMCQNYCLNGDCHVSVFGKLTCDCGEGFVGSRCERSKCDDYCLNGGDCSIVSSRGRPQCRCPEVFMGDRCEYSTDICDLYCNDRGDQFFSEKYELLCRCSASEGFKVLSERNHTSAMLSAASVKQDSFFSKLNDPLYYLTALVFTCLLIIITLVIYIRVVRKRRPRIKKRIIVNKNVQPLTYRPQTSTEQCEITIENCCNMNVCETPCFEPRTRQEDKKILLSSMDGEDAY